MKNRILILVAISALLFNGTLGSIATKVHFIEDIEKYIQLGPHPVMEVDYSSGDEDLIVSSIQNFKFNI